MRRSTISRYTTPAIAVAPTTCAGSLNRCHGALRTAASSKTATKWITVGVPKALSESGLRGRDDSFTRATTTNIKPVRPPADDPTMTQKLSHWLSKACADVSISTFCALADDLTRHNLSSLDTP